MPSFLIENHQLPQLQKSYSAFFITMVKEASSIEGLERIFKGIPQVLEQFG